jgi:hypothetical protein
MRGITVNTIVRMDSSNARTTSVSQTSCIVMAALTVLMARTKIIVPRRVVKNLMSLIALVMDPCAFL